jgi:hypothetical protein
MFYIDVVTQKGIKELIAGGRMIPSTVGRRASVAIDGTVLAGSLEHRALQFVREWASLRSEEILANWERARKSETLLSIPPLP